MEKVKQFLVIHFMSIYPWFNILLIVWTPLYVSVTSSILYCLYIFSTLFINNTTNPKFKLIKSAYWNLIRIREVEYIIEKKVNPLLQYPMFIWLAFEAEDLYLISNRKQFSSIVAEKYGELMSGMFSKRVDLDIIPYHGSEEDLDLEENRFIDETLAKLKQDEPTQKNKE